MPLQIRRGLNADRLLFMPAEGEIIYTTDTKKVFVGDGVTAGGIEISSASTGGGGELEPHTHPIAEITGLQGALDSINTSLDGKQPLREYGSYFTHNQASASAIWTVTHNLGYYPNVTVVNSAGDVIIVDISYVDGNQLLIKFDSANSGKAYLS